MTIFGIHAYELSYIFRIHAYELSYFSVAAVTIATILLLLLLSLLPLLTYYFATKYFAADTKFSRCG